MTSNWKTPYTRTQNVTDKITKSRDAHTHKHTPYVYTITDTSAETIELVVIDAALSVSS
jgi:hypothetical protein